MQRQGREPWPPEQQVRPVLRALPEQQVQQELRVQPEQQAWVRQELRDGKEPEAAWSASCAER